MYIYTSDVTVCWVEFFPDGCISPQGDRSPVKGIYIRQGDTDVDILATASGYMYIITMTEGKRKRKIENTRQYAKYVLLCSGF
jgi:hypothetical protein